MKKLLLLLNLSILSIYLYGQVTRTANVATPGTLASVASSYLTTVTNLTVTGTIDARDFVTMRDKMTSLTTIDLSSVLINSYIDAGANLGLGNNWEYKANGIPDFAFVTPLYKAKTILKKIILPLNSTSIGESAFDGCTGLENIIIGSAMSIISSYAFFDCSGLTSFNINTIVPPVLGNKVFENSNYASCILTVPLGSVGLYKFYDQWKLFTNITDGTPTVETTAISNISTTTATSGGNITSSGSTSITSRGVCWSTTLNPNVDDSKTNNGTGIGLFTSSITNLAASTTYYVRAYATNSVGTAYGENVTFSTSSETLPTVTTTTASAITSSTASVGGSITSSGSGTITARGVCWGTSANPTVTNNKTSNGTGPGTFSSSITGLAPGITYHYRAYATSTVGTAYGSDLTFTTLSPPTVTTSTIKDVTTVSAILGGNVTSAGSSTVTARGVCWSTTTNPTIADSKTSDGTGTGSFTSNIIGLSMGTTYYARAYATNSIGTSYGSEVSFKTLSNSTEVYLNNIAFISKAQDATKSNVPTSMLMNPLNQNNFVNPGNNVRFKMQCHNVRTSGTNIVSGLCKVRTKDPYLVLTDSTSGLNNVAWNGTQWSTDEFEVQIKPTTPLGYVAYVDFVVIEGSNTYNTYQVPILVAPLSLQSRTIDDDSNPDSQGNSNGICEPGETIESFPYLQNVSSFAANTVFGAFDNFHNVPNINVWNNKTGVSGTVVNNSYWNYAFNAPQPIVAGAKDMTPQWDFVFDYKFDKTYSFTLGLAMSGSFQLFSGYQSFFRWLVPVTYNSDYPEFNTALNEFTANSIMIYPNPTKGKIFLESEINEQHTVSLYDITGKKVFSNTVNQNGLIVDLSDYGLKGLYMVQFVDKSGVLIKEQKIIFD
ncbi:MAG: leucine-rich repeat protein [Paludibacter sp.]|nr:leucine-rich repeat protein [Paludibacter sp.]